MKPIAPPPGLAAQWPSLCPRCEHNIGRNDRIVFARGAAIHVECASGGDDE